MPREEITLEYSKYETNEIHYEDISEFGSSLFRNTYLSAFRQVENIINCNLEKRNVQIVNEGNERRKKKQIDNLVCFVGGRGTGKTSAMLSFMEALKDYYYRKKEDLFYTISINGDYRNISFLCLDHIDASLLENGEDLFEVILTMMYDKLDGLERENFLRRDNFNFQKDQLLRRFETTFAGIRNLKKSENNFGEYDSYIGTMKSMSVSMTLRNEFDTLVNAYLSLIRFRKEGETPDTWSNNEASSYLVVTIDDIDLNLESGYKMLEQIHRYLMIKRVIVLLAVDDIQMRRICEKHFWDLYQNNPNKKRMQEWEEHVLYTSVQYMNKVIPLSRRIYMPRIQDMQHNLLIGNGTDERTEQVKQYILHNIVAKTQIAFDICGSKRHFYEPNTVREIVSLSQMLDDMENLKIDAKEFSFDDFEHNYMLMNADIYRRMAGDLLLGDHYQKFGWIRENTLKRQGEAAWNALKIMINKDNMGDFKELIAIKDVHKYSYGELLRVIYLYGRLKPENKDFIKCLLAAFTVTFNRQFILMKYHKNEETRKKAQTNLAALLGGSVTGTWTDQMLAKVKVDSNQRDSDVVYSIGNVENVNMESIQIKKLLPKSWIEHSDRTAKGKLKQSLKKKMSWIKDLEILLMFFSDFRDDMFNRCKCSIQILPDVPEDIEAIKIKDLLSRDPAVDKSDEDMEVIQLQGRANFNLFGFVNALYRWDAYFEEIHDAIKNMICSYYKIAEQDDVDNIQKWIEENSLKKEYSIWKSTYYGFVLPFYNLDMTYNVLKRAMNEFDELSAHVVKKENIVDEIGNMYDRIKKQLSAEYQKYEGLVPEAWDKAFSECPFYVEFMRRWKNGVKREILENVLIMSCRGKSEKQESRMRDELSSIDVMGMS